MFFTQLIVLATLALVLTAAPLEAPPSRISLPLTKRSASRPSDLVALTSVNGEVFSATITIRSTMFEVVIDTASHYLVLPGPLNEEASNHNRAIFFAPPQVQISNVSLTRQSVDQGDSSGVIRQASVKLGDLTADRSSVLSARSISSWLFRPNVDADGFFGLCPGDEDTPDLLMTLVDEELTLGPPNNELYRGNIAHVAVEAQYHWELGVELSLGDRTVLNFVTVRMNTASEYIAGDTASITAFYKALSSKARRRHGDPDSILVFWEFPCSSLSENAPVKLAFDDGPATVTLSRESLMSGTGTESDFCVGKIVERTDLGPNTWRLGTPFFHDLYVIFDDTPGRRRMGFAAMSDAVKDDPCTPIQDVGEQ